MSANLSTTHHSSIFKFSTPLCKKSKFLFQYFLHNKKYITKYEFKIGIPASLKKHETKDPLI